MKKGLILFAIMLCGAIFAVPPEVNKLADEMLSRGVELRAGESRELGLVVVASGTMDISGGNTIKAHEMARTLAKETLAGFMNKNVSSRQEIDTKYVSNGDKETVTRFFSAQTEANINEMLARLQDVRSFVKGEAVTCILCVSQRPAQVGDDQFTVKAVGEAAQRDEALQKAMRNAVEQVMGSFVVSGTVVQDLDKYAGKVCSGALGLVEKYNVVSEEKVDVGVRLTIVAKVAKQKLLDSYSVFLKFMGNPQFYFQSDSEELATPFQKFFKDKGMHISEVPDGKTAYRIDIVGKYREAIDPTDGDKGTQLSMTVKIRAIDGTEVLLALSNNPSRTWTSVGSLDRQREIAAEKAFREIQPRLHAEVQKMFERLMDRHMDALMNSAK